MFPELSLLTWNLELWIASEVVLLVKFSDLTTLSLDKVELEIIGPRVITLKVTNLELNVFRTNNHVLLQGLNWLTPFWMWLGKRQSLVIAYRDSS